MTGERLLELARLERMMTTVPGFDYEARARPCRCEDCEFHRPDWRYRYCYHTRCPYSVKDVTFRRKPLPCDPPDRG